MKKNKSVAFSLHTKLSFKMTVVGGKGSGKTSTIVRYVKNAFHPNYHMTLGIEYYSKVVHLPEDAEIALQIWDTVTDTKSNR